VFKLEDMTYESACEVYEPNNKGLLAISTQPDPDMPYSVAVYPFKPNHKIAETCNKDCHKKSEQWLKEEQIHKDKED